MLQKSLGLKTGYKPLLKEGSIHHHPCRTGGEDNMDVDPMEDHGGGNGR